MKILGFEKKVSVMVSKNGLGLNLDQKSVVYITVAFRVKIISADILM